MRILVTGATGFIGSQLVPVLLEEGHELRLLSRVSAPQQTDNPELLTGSLPNKALCQQLCQGMEVAIHLAGIAHVTATPGELKRQNLDATVELAEAARAQGVKRFIFLSSSKAAWPTHSAYAGYKAATEKHLLALQDPGNFTVHCLRPALVYGPGMRGNLGGLLRVLARPHLPVFIKSSNALGMISVTDVCRAITACVDAANLPGQVWALADGESYTLDQIVYHVRAELGLPQPRVFVPRLLMHALAQATDLISPIYRSSFSMSTYKTLFVEQYRHDPAFSQHTGFSPADTFYTRLPAMLESFQ